MVGIGGADIAHTTVKYFLAIGTLQAGKVKPPTEAILYGGVFVCVCVRVSKWCVAIQTCPCTLMHVSAHVWGQRYY